MSVPRKSPRQQRSRETVAAILEAAAQLFQRHGYAATTTNGVAERAGVSIGSLYQYFPNKDALLTALAREHLRAGEAELHRFFAECAARGPGLRPLLAELVGAVARMHTDRPGLHRLLFDRTPRTPELVDELRGFEHRMAQALAVELRRTGCGGPDPLTSALLAVQGIEAQVHGALLDPDDAPGRAARTQAITELWTRALSAPSTG